MEAITALFGQLFFALAAAAAAEARGRNGLIWFLLSFVITAPAALILVLVSRNLEIEREKQAAAASEKMRASQLKTCPRCAELVQKAAFVCRYCGQDFQAANLKVSDLVYSGPQPQAGAESSARVIKRENYKGYHYRLHKDGTVSCALEAGPHTWRSMVDFIRWADFYSVGDGPAVVDP